MDEIPYATTTRLKGGGSVSSVRITQFLKRLNPGETRRKRRFESSPHPKEILQNFPLMAQ
jgi:hypothetical protein